MYSYFSLFLFFWKTALGNEEEQWGTDCMNLLFTRPRVHFHFSRICFFVVKLYKLWELPNERAASRTPMTGSKHGGFSTPQSILYACFNQKRPSDWLGSSTLKQVCWLTDDPASVQLQNIRSRTLSAFYRSCGFFRCWCHIFNFVFGFWEWNVDMNKLSLRMFETNWYWIGKNYKNHFQTLVMHL